MKCDELIIENACVYGPGAKVYLAEQVDAAIAELKAENERLESIRKVHVEAIASMEAGLHQDDKKIRRLKRALWLARAERALAERRRYCAMAAFENIENDALRIKWCIIQHECFKKAEEYK